MIQVNLDDLFANAALGSVIAAALPFYVIFLTLGWAWRLWIRMVSQTLSLAIYTRESVRIG